MSPKVTFCTVQEKQNIENNSNSINVKGNKVLKYLIPKKCFMQQMTWWEANKAEKVFDFPRWKSCNYCIRYNNNHNHNHHLVD